MLKEIFSYCPAGENHLSNCLFRKLATFNSFVGMPTMCFEKEIYVEQVGDGDQWSPRFHKQFHN